VENVSGRRYGRSVREPVLMPMAGGVTVGCDDGDVSRKRRKKRRRPANGPLPPGRGTGDRAAEPGGESLVDGSNGSGPALRWKDERHGARTVRGIHFQDAAVTWLAAKVAAGHIPNVLVVPEGSEDVLLEGGAQWHVQVKSRVERRGLFSASEAAGHILCAWRRHAGRDDARSRLVVVLESGVEGEMPSNDLDKTLAESLAGGSQLLTSLRKKGSEFEMDVGRLLSSTVVVGISWDDVIAETVACLGEQLELPPAALRLVADQLRVFLANAADDNETPIYEQRRRLDRTELASEITRIAGMVSIESLQAAIQQGVCEPLEYGSHHDAEGARFYEGAATQPFHVASGLVVRRSDVIARVLSGLDERSAVVITGPSGVGKSAVLWTIPREPELRGVAWFRVRRIADEDVSAIVRLARAYCASPSVPIGFLVDSAGAGDLTGWARLRAEAAAVPGMLLVATARREDLAILGDLAECATVAVQLDESAAEAIHGGLVASGATAVAHWREAFDKSGGLTLEFTHLLTRGRRLRDLIDDQIRRRIRENRDKELDVLALVSVADRWSATVSTERLAQACGLSCHDLRRALDRLDAEHLVVERDGQMGGLHRLRSTAICQAVHELASPAIGATIQKAIPLVSAAQLHRFIAAMLEDNPDARGIVADQARSGELELERVAACLQGLRLADFQELARAWNDVADQHNVPPANRPTMFAMAVQGGEPAGFLPDDLQTAERALVAVPGRDSRYSLIEAAGRDVIARLLTSVSDSGRATLLLATLANTGPDLARAIANAFDEYSPLVPALCDAPLEGLKDCLSAARDVDPHVAHALVENIGGEQVVIQRIRADNPWITELGIRDGDDGPVGFARFLHVSDDVQGDMQEQAHSLGRTLLWCLPRIASVDVKALWPGNLEPAIGGDPTGVSRLKREHAPAASSVAWTQARIRVAATPAGVADTVRLTEALPLLSQANDLVQRAGAALLTGRSSPGPGVGHQRRFLRESAQALRPALGKTGIDDTAILEQRPPELADDLAATVLNITDNAILRLQSPDGYQALAAYISVTIIGKNLDGARKEPWRLIGIEGYPPSLDELRSTLEDIRDVVSELAHNGASIDRIRQAARSGEPSYALQRGARVCRSANERRHRKRIKQIQSTCANTGLQARVFDHDRGWTSVREYRISVELGSLTEWNEAVQELTAAIRQDQKADETFLFVPLRNTRPVPRLAFSLVNRLWHTPNPSGLDRLPEAHADKVTGIFNRAVFALQGLSGVSDLADELRGHNIIHAAIEALSSDLEEAVEQLVGMSGEPVPDALLSGIGYLCARVQAELDGTSLEPGVAAQCVKGLLTEEHTNEAAWIYMAQCLASELDAGAALCDVEELIELVNLEAESDEGHPPAESHTAD